MKIDFHLHTWASFDCESNPAEIVNWAVRKGLDCLAVTEHDNTEGCAALRTEAEKQGLFVIAGIELTVSRGTHYLIYLTPDLPLPKDDLDMISEIHRRGGLVGVAHPYRSDTGLIYNQLTRGLYDLTEVERILLQVDFIEVFNAKSLSEQNVKARLLAEKFPHLKQIAGSDSHHPATVGAAHTEVMGFSHSDIKGMAKQLKILESKIVVMSELDESVSSRNFRRAVEGFRRMMIKIKPAMPDVAWKSGRGLYRKVSNSIASKQASRSIIK